MMQVVVNI